MASDALKHLMEKADKGILTLPEFQRDFVWKPESVKKLITSLLNGYPIGGLLFMEDEGKYGARALDGAPDLPKQRQTPSDGILVLDGQQRLTSCYRAFYGALTTQEYPGRYYFDYGAYLKNPNVKGSEEVESLIVFVPAKKVMQKLNTAKDEQSAGLFPLDIIFKERRGTIHSKWLSDYSYSHAKGDPDEFGRLSQCQAYFISNFIERITGYQIHFEEIPKGADSDVICTVFETINTTGKRLTVFDLLVARCYKGNIQLRTLLEHALAAKPFIRHFDPDGDDLCTFTLPRIFGLLNKGSCKRGDLLDLDANQIRDSWDKAIDSLELALQVLVERFGAYDRRFVPLIDMVAPMAVILIDPKYQKAGRKAENLLSKWYWRSVFGRYFVTSGETKAARTVKEWGIGPAGDKSNARGWLDDEREEPESVKKFPFPKNLLEGVTRKDDTVYRGVMSLLLTRQLRDLQSPQPLLTKKDVSEFEDHHIFPNKYLSTQGIKRDDINQISNRTPILADTNIKISSRAPHVYLNDTALVGARGLDADVLEGHIIPPWVATDATFSEVLYKRFIDERQSQLLKEIARLVDCKPAEEIDG